MGGKDPFPLCALEYFIRITKQWYNNKRKKTKKTPEFPKIVRVKWWDGTSPDHLATTLYSSNPTPGVLLWMIDSSLSGLTPGREFFLGGLASTVSCACSYICPFLDSKDLLRERERERERVDKGGVLLRKNETKVFTAIGNYLNNSEDFGKANGKLTNPCVHMTRTQYASWYHHCDSTPSLWSHPYGHRLACSFLIRN